MKCSSGRHLLAEPVRWAPCQGSGAKHQREAGIHGRTGEAAAGRATYRVLPGPRSITSRVSHSPTGARARPRIRSIGRIARRRTGRGLRHAQGGRPAGSLGGKGWPVGGRAGCRPPAGRAGNVVWARIDRAWDPRTGLHRFALGAMKNFTPGKDLTPGKDFKSGPTRRPRRAFQGAQPVKPDRSPARAERAPGPHGTPVAPDGPVPRTARRY